MLKPLRSLYGIICTSSVTESFLVSFRCQSNTFGSLKRLGSNRSDTSQIGQFLANEHPASTKNRSSSKRHALKITFHDVSPSIGGGKTKNIHALDCGSGIGRITKRLLLPIFKYVDMVELSQHFLDAAGQFIGSDISRVERRICCGLQDFNPERERYDVIWCQWVLGHLKDDDLVDFLRRCKTGLTPDGLIIIKENFTSAESKDFDSDDSSYTRPRELLMELIKKSGLKILQQQKQKGFPKGLYDVYMFATQ